MAAPPLDPGPLDETGGAGPGRRSRPGVPRWVKASWIVALVVVLLVVILLLIGGGHGPGRHRSTGITLRLGETEQLTWRVGDTASLE